MMQVDETIFLEPLRITDQILVILEDERFELNTYGQLITFISIARIAKPNEGIKVLKLSAKPFHIDKLTGKLWSDACSKFFEAVKLNEDKAVASNGGLAITKQSTIEVDLGI